MYIIGLDVGTTGTKAVLADEYGKIISSGYKEYELITEEGGRVSQNAADWWDAAVFAIRKATENVADKTLVKAIGMSTQGASMLAADKNGNALSEVITWMDNRSTDETKFLDEKIGKEAIYEKCGWPLTPAGDAAKILWIKNNMPQVFDKTDCFISTIEYMNFKLCGEYITDPTNAAIRQLYNIKTAKWDEEILSVLGIDESRLPKVVSIGSEVGNLTKNAARELGLSESVKVYCGAHDQYCAALGCGAVNTGDMLLATGTTWVVLGVTKSLLYTPSHISPGIHPVSGAYGAMASLVSAGSSMKWYKNLIDGDFKLIDNEAEKRMSSAAELYFFPYLAGAGFPHNRPDLHGSIMGLEIRHDKYDIALALMEGVAFEAKQVLREFSAQGMNISSLMMTGGAARSDLWSSIVGYVTGCEIYRMQEPETCSVGAVMIAAVGAGIFPSYAECGKVMVKSSKLDLPDKEKFDFYSNKEKQYQNLRAMLLNI